MAKRKQAVAQATAAAQATQVAAPQVQPTQVPVPRARKVGFKVTVPGRRPVPPGYWSKPGMGGYAAVTSGLPAQQAAEKYGVLEVCGFAEPVLYYRRKYGLPQVDDPAEQARIRKVYLDAMRAGQLARAQGNG